MSDLYRKINEECGVRLPEPDEQDWARCAGDYRRIEDYIRFYRVHRDDLNRLERDEVAMMIVSGVDEYMEHGADEALTEALWAKTREILLRDRYDLMNTIGHFACYGDPLDECFPITAKIRSLWLTGMQIRPYRQADFDTVRRWFRNARTHALWCANRFPYPLEQAGFDAVLREHAAQTGDRPYVAENETGLPFGFFCFSLNPETNEGMLKFVAVDSNMRGWGIGTEMLRLAVRKAFAETDADAVQLMVFSDNIAARKCYQKSGFTERSVTPDAFRFGDEAWGRVNMVIRRSDFEMKE